MNFTVNFYLSLISFLVFVVSGAFFLYLWLVTAKKPRFIFYIAAGFIFFLLFKLPNILINYGIEVEQNILYPFFFISMVLYTVSYALLNSGLTSFTVNSPGRLKNVLLKVVVIAAVVYFAFSFLLGGVVSFAPVWLSHLFILIPAQFILLHTLHEVQDAPVESLMHSGRLRNSIRYTRLGIYLAVISSVIYILIQTKVTFDQFWYVSVVSSRGTSMVQIAAGMLLFLGFYNLVKSATDLKE